jgi:tRNA modification GTPase
MAIAMNQVEGRLSKLVNGLRQTLLEILAHIEVNIDYPEYDDVEEMTNTVLIEKAKTVRVEIQKLLETSKQGKILREGLSTVIIGRPNVGKSSLLNTLVQESKAIVTDIPGTTRDVIEEYVNVKGVPLRLIDTAGIRETKDVVEAIGVERSKKVLNLADLVLFVLNNNEQLSEEDRKLFDEMSGKDVIVIINKTDLPQKLDLNEVKALVGNATVVTTSLKEEKGIDDLEKAIADLYFEGQIEAQDLTYLSNARHIALLKQSEQTINDAIEAMKNGMPIDLVQIDLTRAWELLGEIVGDTVQESLINQLFSQFCLGK